MTRTWIFGAMLLAAAAPAEPASLGDHDFVVSSKLPGFWQATPAQAAEAKAALIAYLRTPDRDLPAFREPGRKEIEAKIGSYYLEYEGVSVVVDDNGSRPDPSGARNIEISGACQADSAEIAAMKAGAPAISLVADGGSCYFDAYYDLGKKRIWLFVPHGVA